MRSELIKIRATQDEKKAFEKASSLAGLSLSAWMRERLRRTVIRELTEAGIKVSFLQSAEVQE
jgi:predicted HTH domain antitoxin